MAIQMRRGLLSAYDKDKMLAGEWGIAIDADTDNQKAYIAFAPGVDKEVMFVDDAQAQIAQAASAAITDATNKAAALVHGNAYTVNDYASGDGSTTVFTLTETPTSITAIYIDGEETTAYTLSGATVTFTTAPAEGTNNIHVVYSVSTATDNAMYYKNQASQSATNAGTSETNAGTSETNAGNSATAAAASALAAATSEDNAEAWAVGQINGTDVGSSDARYHNNSKYYSEQSANSAAEAAASAASLDVETILGDFATYEPEATAAYSHTKDKYLIWSDSKLYKVTANISVGDTIAKGTNIASNPTTVGDEVAALNSNLTYPTAGAHNSIYRGKYLGASVSTAQYAAIKAGTFDDLFIGDYWTINSVNWRIAGFDYWLNHGDTSCTTHHVVIVPDSCLGTQKMNDSNTTAGGYVGSKMYTTYMATSKSAINSAFGSAHILSHREYLTNAITNGYASAGAWYDSTIDLMNEVMVYGTDFFTPHNSLGATIPNTHTVGTGQLPLFMHDHSWICNRANWWLRDVASAALFAIVNNSGICHCYGASNSCGVRPAFGIIGA